MSYRISFRSPSGFTLGPVGFIIIVNIIFFLVTLFRPDILYLLGLRPEIFLSRPWTIISNLFIHAGFGHLFANMLTLYFFGTFLSRIINERRFLIVYFIGGIVGNLLYILLAAPFSIAVGASGAVFAAGGALAVLRPKQTVFIFPIPVPIPLWVAVVGGFVIISFFPDIAWQGHLGGLLFGAAFAYVFERRR